MASIGTLAPHSRPWQLLRLQRLPMILQSEAAECGLACLAMIGGFHGYHCDLNHLRARFPQSLQGATLRELIDIAAQLGFSCRALRVDMESVPDLQRPCILHWNLNHFVVLKRAGSGHVTIHDPAAGSRRMTWSEMSQCFTGVALELIPTSDFSPEDKRQRLGLPQLWSRLEGLRRTMICVLLLSLLLQLFSLLSPLYLQTVVDDVLLRNDENLLPVLAIGFTLLLAIETMTAALRRLVILHCSSYLGLQLASNLFHHLLRLPAQYFERRHLGDTVTRFRSIDEIRELLTTGLVSTLVDGLLAVSTFCVMYYYNSTLSLLILCALGLYALLRLALFYPARRLTEEGLAADAATQTSFMESIRAIVTVKLQQAEAEREALWQSRLGHSINRGIQLELINIAHGSANTLLLGIANILVIFHGASAIMAGGMTLGMLYAFLSFSQRFITATQGLIEQLLAIRMLGLHLERLADIALNQVEPCCDRERSSLFDSSKDGNNCKRLQTAQLGFRYSNNRPAVFTDLSLDIAPGDSVVITGPSGCGKTTLLKCLMGLLPAEIGSVTYGGNAVYGSARFRSRIAAVLQEDSLFSGSIADNITASDPSPRWEDLVATARYTQIHDEIDDMPMGYNTLVGDMGSTLSGGQKQRILLARALYRKPDILFLDEATCHLDPVREAAIISNLSKLQITRIMVAHRQETVRWADTVIELG